MVNRAAPAARRLARGAAMIEVLVTMVIIAFGLLGLSGLQVRLQASEMEAYQRTQALLLLNDLKGRMEANRLQVGQYDDEAPVATPLGVGMDCPAPGASALRVKKDAAEWCNLLQGAAETKAATRLGAIVGARGCVEDLGTGANGDRSMRVTVAWQGLTPTAPPVEACGAGQYNGPAGASCQGDLCRRTVSTIVRIAKLQ